VKKVRRQGEWISIELRFRALIITYSLPSEIPQQKNIQARGNIKKRDQRRDMRESQTPPPPPSKSLIREHRICSVLELRLGKARHERRRADTSGVCYLAKTTTTEGEDLKNYGGRSFSRDPAFFLAEAGEKKMGGGRWKGGGVGTSKLNKRILASRGCTALQQGILQL